MYFKEVLGQEKLKKLLMRSVREGYVPHAQLFLGPKGSANLALALAFAKYVPVKINNKMMLVELAILCEAFEFVHPDLHFVFPVATTLL